MYIFPIICICFPDKAWVGSRERHDFMIFGYPIFLVMVLLPQPGILERWDNLHTWWNIYPHVVAKYGWDRQESWVTVTWGLCIWWSMGKSMGHIVQSMGDFLWKRRKFNENQSIFKMKISRWGKALEGRKGSQKMRAGQTRKKGFWTYNTFLAIQNRLLWVIEVISYREKRDLLFEVYFHVPDWPLSPFLPLYPWTCTPMLPLHGGICGVSSYPLGP